MSRGSVQRQNNSTYRGLDPLGQAVIDGVIRKRDQLVELTEHATNEDLVVTTALAAIAGKRAGKRCLIVAASEQRLSRIDQLIQQRVQSGEGVTITRLTGTVSQKANRVHGRSTIMLATAESAIDHLRRRDKGVRASRICIVDAIGAEKPEQFGADLQFIYTKLHARPVSVAFVPEAGPDLELLFELLRRPLARASAEFGGSSSPGAGQEQYEEKSMSELPFSESELKEKISDIMREIHEEEDPIEMTRLKRLVRKHTSVFNRSYITAFLLKQSLGGGSAPRRKRKERPTGGGKGQDQDQQSIFVSIGRNRRVHTRDLITFFTSADGITSDDIGQIKVLDNYSFVELNKDKAQAAIEALNGQELRGRKLTVNFARRK